MQNSIAPGAIKISLFQTVPGEELVVKKALEKACKQDKIMDYVFFKALGTFDLALIYVTKDYGVSIGKFGPIPSILKSNHLLCYSYRSNTAKSILISLKNSKLMGLSLLKIDPMTHQTYPWIERELRDYITRQAKNWLLMGSIGWNEIIMIVALENVNRIVKELLEMSAVVLRRNNVPVLAKTLSFVCINYQCMPPSDVLESGLDQTKGYLNKHRFLSEAKVGRKGAPSVEITAKPIYANSISKYFSQEGFKGCHLLGKYDLCFEPSPAQSWADCLGSILHFRHHFNDKAFSTCTRLRLKLVSEVARYSENPWEVPIVDFSYKELEKKYGKRAASSLANHFYSFNSLIQNPLYGSAFLDMADYPKHVLKTGNELGDIERLRLAHGAREVLRYGSELRLCGTFQSIEEETGKFSEIQGGGQRALLALEYLPYHVFKRLKGSWSGFIVTSHYDKLMHVNEVIQVPTYTLWKPQTWWTLYHEIAHIWIDLSPEVVSYKVPVIKEFLVNKNNTRHWLGKLMELAAEIIGFELGFFGNYDLYLKLYWNHIKEIDPTQRTMFDFGDYAMRSFFTWFYWRCFGNATSERLTKKEFMDADFVYPEFLKHMGRIEAIVGRRLFLDRHFVAADKAQLCSDLYLFASHLAAHVTHYRLRVSLKSLDSANTRNVVDSLLRGKIWWEKMSCPEAVIYRISGLQGLNFQKAMAMVITFWNQQVAVYKQRFR
jgi:hypothetical protein